MFQEIADFVKAEQVMRAPLPASLVSGILTAAKLDLPIRESPNQLLRVPTLPSTDDLCKSINQCNRLSSLTPEDNGPSVMGQSKAKKEITL
jgi:hypothetical protein